MNSLLTAKEVAGQLKVSQNTIYELALAGKLPAIKVGARGGRYRFRQEDVDSYLKASQLAPRLPDPPRKERVGVRRGNDGYAFMRAGGWKG